MFAKKTALQQQREQSLKDALNVIGEHFSISQGDAVLRENARLYQHNKSLKQQLLIIWISILILSVGLISITLFFLHNYPKTKFIVTTNNKAVCEVGALDKPNVSSSSVETFAQEAILELLRYDYLNFEQQLKLTLNRYFTNRGKQSYYKSLDISGNLAKVKTNKMISRAFITRTPQIEKESLRGGQYTWVVIVPINNEFFIGNDSINNVPHSKQDYHAIVTIIQEQATAINPKGIAVDALILKPI